jgi:ankyrin repeat protein
MKIHFRRQLIAVAISLFTLGAGAPGDEELVEAAKKADRAAVQALLKAGTDVNSRAGDGSTALLWASYRDDLEIVDMLLRARADVNAANDLGASPIWAAARNGSAAMTKKLLDAGANPNAKLMLGESAVVTAARSGNPEVVELLIAKGADPNAKAARGQTALMFAASQGHAEAVAVLVRRGADVNAKSDVWGQVEAQAPHSHPAMMREFMHGGNTALMFAARAGDLASAKVLVEAGADVNAASAHGTTPISMAAYSDFYPARAENDAYLYADPVVTGRAAPPEHAAVVRYLLDKGADPDGGAKVFTPLIVSALRHREATVQLLLERGADPNIPLGDWLPIVRGSPTDFYIDMGWVGASPLWLAARYSTPAIVRMLLAKGADPKFVHTGAFYSGNGDLAERNEEIGTTLLAATRVVGNRGGTWADSRETSEAQVLEIVQLLVDAGVDINAKASNERTAVEGANEADFKTVVDYLVSKGAPRPAPIDPASRGRRRR